MRGEMWVRVAVAGLGLALVLVGAALIGYVVQAGMDWATAHPREGLAVGIAALALVLVVVNEWGSGGV